MNPFLLLVLLMSALPLLAKESNYLGTDRADVEAGLRLYTEKQLADMKRKNREAGMTPEPVKEELRPIVIEALAKWTGNADGRASERVRAALMQELAGSGGGNGRAGMIPAAAGRESRSAR